MSPARYCARVGSNGTSAKPSPTLINYKNFEFEIPEGLVKMATPTIGTSVRMMEMRQSLRIIEQAVEGILEGPIMAKVPKVMKPPVGEVSITRSKPARANWDTSS